MKLFLATLFLLFGLNLFAVETQNTATTAAPVYQTKETHWSFLIGKSMMQLNQYEKGNGLTIATTYNFTPLIGAGIGYTEFKTFDQEFQTHSDLHLLNSFVSLTPIHYDFGNMQFLGGLQVGLSSADFSNNSNNSGFYYGASAALNIENQVGFSIETKTSRLFDTVNTLSMIGYY